MDFKAQYSREEYIRFFSTLFGNGNFQKIDRSTPTQSGSFGDSMYFKGIHTLGLVRELEGLDDGLIVLEIQHQSSRDARVGLTKELMKLLSSTEIEGTYRGNALVILTNPNDDTYRLSLFTTSYDKTQGYKKVLSNPRRQSFLLGIGEKIKTPEKQLKNQIKNFSDLVERFKVEVVRKEFFDDYIDLFIRLYIALGDDIQFMEVLKKEGVDQVKFTKNLLGKIVFIYFIQKKGWLGLGRETEWGTGDKNFMRNLWMKFITGENFVRPSTGNFYNDYLEHLFYNGFNKDRRDDDAYDPITRMKIPYLNGGLFKEDYKEWEHFDAKILNDIFSNGKDGILDKFDLYNFTIDEDDIFDSEVAVDPEMLGKIFEKMISVSSENIDEIIELYKVKGRIQIGNELNKKFGAFYTPREIVHYMTRESLLAYLSTGLKGKKEENDEKIKVLISAKDRHISNGDKDKVDEIQIVSSIAEEVDILLQKVKILDPAIGSGAFPMGILHEISTLRYYLHSEGFCTIHKHIDDEGSEDLTERGYISMYRIKRDTIKNSIYGVDIEPGAIDIARLRFWLSLVVDATEPEPLPNFEFKFVAANTLIPLDDENIGEQTQLAVDDTVNIKTVRKYMLEYYDIDRRKSKEDVIQRIKSYIGKKYNLKELSQLSLDGTFSPRQKQILSFSPFDPNYSNPFFDPSLMMGEGRGFDIVIGNPPYGSKIDKENKEKYAELYPSAKKKKRFDLFNFFMIYSLGQIKNKGIVSYIVPQTWLVNEGNKLLRKKLIQNGLYEIDLLGGDIFDTATVDTLIYFLQSGKESELKINSGAINNGFFTITNTETKKDFNENFDLISGNDSSGFELLKKCSINTTLLGDISKIVFGIQTRKDKTGLSYLHTKLENKFCKRAINGKHMGRYFTLTNEELFVEYGDWLWNKRDINIFEAKQKILVRQVGSIPICSLDTNQIFTLNTIFNLVIKNDTFDIKYVLSLLNSKLVARLWFVIFPEAKEIFPRIKKEDLIKIPIKNISINDQQILINLVDQIINFKKQDPKANTLALERQIDLLIYQLYDLTPEEIAIVEGKV